MSEIGQRIIEATRTVARERADFSYTGECQYVEDGQPGCLIGHALWNLGLIDETFEQLHHNLNGVEFCLEQMAIEVDEDELQWLTTAQEQQDKNMTWGYAVGEANNRFNV